MNSRATTDAAGRDRPGSASGDAPETREPALPDGDPARGVTGVVTPVGRDVGDARADQASDDEGEGDTSRRAATSKSDFGQSPSGVEEADVGRDGEAEAVGVKDEGTEVKRGGDAGHG